MEKEPRLIKDILDDFNENGCYIAWVIDNHVEEKREELWSIAENAINSHGNGPRIVDRGFGV